MKTSAKSKLNERGNVIWVSIALFCSLVIFVSISLHITPSHLIALVENFATHHFILVSFFLFFITLLVLRYYYKNTAHSNQKFFLKKKSAEKTSLVTRLSNRVNLDYQTLKSHFIGIHQIDSLVFGFDDVLKDRDSRLKRELELNKAMKLGNSYKHKVKIYFKDSVSNKHVYTSVWYVSESHVTLKYGVVIPVKSIYQVKF